jgi:hypothetical protein
VVSGQWSVVSGQWSVVSGQWSVVSGQWSVVSGDDLRVLAFVKGFQYPLLLFMKGDAVRLPKSKTDH